MSATPTPPRNIYQDGSYLARNQSWHVEDSPWKAAQVAQILARNKIQPRTVAEVGCGAGEILRQLSITLPQSTFYGFELSPQAFELCQQRVSDRVRFYLADVTLSEQSFDVALCIDVFEHVDDYLGFLRSFRRVATDKVFHIPLDIYVLSVLRKTMMATRKYVGHLHYFTKATALATLQDTGYQIIDHYYTKSFAAAPSNSTEARLLRLPRRLLSAIAPEVTQTWLGGHSLLVLAR